MGNSTSGSDSAPKTRQVHLGKPGGRFKKFGSLVGPGRAAARLACARRLIFPTRNQGFGRSDAGGPGRLVPARGHALVVRYAEAAVIAERAVAVIRADGDLAAAGKPSGWFKVHSDATRTMAMLATKLRIGPLARAPNDRAPARRAAPVSYYERMQIEGFTGDDSDNG
jgi:hypothetical protein